MKGAHICSQDTTTAFSFPFHPLLALVYMYIPMYMYVLGAGHKGLKMPLVTIFNWS